MTVDRAGWYLSPTTVSGCLLNMDLAELPDEPEELYALAQVASIACGGHAGNADSMARALTLCIRHGTLAGAHPSYPDRQGFGRRRLVMPPALLKAAVAEQCDALAEQAAALGVALRTIKPHGALYHAGQDEPSVAEAVVAGAVEALGYEISVIGPPGGALAHAAGVAGVAYWREGFADRGRRADGSLVPRGQSGALVESPELARQTADALARSGLVETVCVHGDTPGALALARAVREALDAYAASLGPG
jgi:UPF0271 protein